MRTKLASASVITLALALGSPAYAQVQQPGAEPAPGVTAPPATAPGTAADPLIEDDPTTPDVADDPFADPTAPGVADDPFADPTAPGVADDPMADPTTPGIADDPLADPTAPGIADDPLADPTAPGVAEDPLADPATPGVAEDPLADPATPGVAEPRLAVDELDDVLGEIGIEDRELFFGSIVRAETEDGAKVAMLVGPENFEVGEGDAAPIAEFAELEGELSEAGFENVQQDLQWVVMQGTLDGHTVFAMEADRGIDRAELDAGNGEFERADAAAIDADALRDRLSEAGIEAEEGFEPKLFRASHDGHTIFLLIGPEGMAAGDSVELSEDEIRERLEQAGLSDIELVEEDIHFVRADHEGSAVLAISGEALQDGARTF